MAEETNQERYPCLLAEDDDHPNMGGNQLMWIRYGHRPRDFKLCKISWASAHPPGKNPRGIWRPLVERDVVGSAWSKLSRDKNFEWVADYSKADEETVIGFMLIDKRRQGGPQLHHSYGLQ